jgi:hypothetical protein
MPRETYSLSDATHDTLEGNVKEIAAGMNKSERHVYKFLAEEINDPFAMFLPLYIAACKKGIPTSNWDSELEFHRERHVGKMLPRDIGECILAEVKRQHRLLERYMQAAEDGKYSASELEDLEGMLLAVMDAVKVSLRGVKLRKEAVEQGSGPRLVG